MKKVLIFLLTLALALSMAACARENTQDPDPSGSEATEAPTMPTYDQVTAAPVIGTWKLNAVMETSQFELEGFQEDVLLPMQFIFREDGTYTLASIPEEMEAVVDQFNKELSAHMAESIYASLAESDLVGEAADEAFQQTYHKTVAEYCDEMVAGVRLADNLVYISYSGTFAVDGDRLFTQDGSRNDPAVSTFRCENDTLTLLDSSFSDIWSELGVTFPLTMPRLAGSAR